MLQHYREMLVVNHTALQHS